MSDSDFKVQWSVSLAPAEQYAKGDMLNLRANTVEELEDQLDAILADESEFMAKATQAAAFLRVAAKLANPSETEPVGKNDAPESGESAPVAALHVCEHGKREYKTGNKKDGSGTYEAWFCPSKDRKNQCKPEWVS